MTTSRRIQDLTSHPERKAEIAQTCACVGWPLWPPAGDVSDGVRDARETSLVPRPGLLSHPRIQFILRLKPPFVLFVPSRGNSPFACFAVSIPIRVISVFRGDKFRNPVSALCSLRLLLSNFVPFLFSAYSAYSVVEHSGSLFVYFVYFAVKISGSRSAVNNFFP